MLITTSKQVTSLIESKAQTLARELGGQLVARNNLSLRTLLKTFRAAEILVVLEDRLKFVSLDGPELFFHPNLAKIRVTRLLRGSTDRLLTVADIKPGDRVLDCTLGLATDTIVLSFAVGSSGKVTSAESELVPFVLAKDGLRTYQSGISALDAAMRRIDVVRANHRNVLRSLPSQSFDVVYFDPMFREPDHAVALEPLRRCANHEPIDQQSIHEARRIARRSIVLKEHKSSGEFERLGFQIQQSKSKSRIDYGVISLD
ncbi:MAG: class I SAM-dependent methyltransferase [Chloroflexota bacterium]|nr:class I SAM-dependent methyltransferase [Chloroflexota bacterium]